VRRSDATSPEKSVAALPTNWLVGNAPVNLQYLACILRLADIMDFDRSRTPLRVFSDIEFTEKRSWEEWNKHLSVSGWEIGEDRVRYQVECSEPSFYVSVHEFLDSVDTELRDCRYLVHEAPKQCRHIIRCTCQPCSTVGRSG